MLWSVANVKNCSCNSNRNRILGAILLFCLEFQVQFTRLIALHTTHAFRQMKNISSLFINCGDTFFSIHPPHIFVVAFWSSSKSAYSANVIDIWHNLHDFWIEHRVWMKICQTSHWQQQSLWSTNSSARLIIPLSAFLSYHILSDIVTFHQMTLFVSTPSENIRIMRFDETRCYSILCATRYSSLNGTLWSKWAHCHYKFCLSVQCECGEAKKDTCDSWQDIFFRCINRMQMIW